MSRPICIVGTGYVGMASMLGLADLGWKVHGYDIVPERVDRLRRGIPPYREPKLPELLQHHIEHRNVHFFDSIEEAASGSQVVIIAVGTPSRDDGSADLSAVRAAVEMLARVQFATWPTIVLRSTVPPGTTDSLAALVAPWGNLIYAPEFLREGSAVRDFLNPDRIVVGSATPAEAVPYVTLLERLQKPVIFTSRSNAELIKCCSNAYLALKISFANEVANLCGAFGATSDDVLRGIGYDQRIGPHFLRPGIGFGGPCFEKDVKSVEFVSAQYGLGEGLFSATLRVNEGQPGRVIRILEEEIGSFAGTTIGVWGLAFKANTDDIRDSLALRIVDELGRRGAKMLVYDPAVHVAPLPVGSRLVTSAVEAARADALLVLTEWPQFAPIDPMTYANGIARRVVVDGRNVLDADRVVAAGLIYRGIGRSGPSATERRSSLASALTV
jgi:UDPglucose 6-dehydrogenase